MTKTKRVQGLTVAAAVLCSGAFVAGPATAAPATQVSESSASTSAKTSTAKAASSDGARSGARKIRCRLRISFKPRVGKRDRRIRTAARTVCNVKVRKIWTSVRLRQTKAKDHYKVSHTKGRARRNTTAIRTFCPKEYRRYTIIGKTTVVLPKRANKKRLKLRKVGHQRGVCRA
ncbi:MAG: hypothetical protein L0K86_14835 [Actinomycetia bacterium]|nr:hypothetical protein [Actinomycetes bacterium]